MRRLSLTLVLCLFAGTAAAADCGDDPRVAALAEAQATATPLGGFAPPASVEEALCLRDAALRSLRQQGLLGRPIGYKVGLTGKAMQERLGIDHPVWGRLFAGMLLPDGSTVGVGYAARPLVEADLLVVVADEGINQATTPDEVARHLGEMKAFIELADLVVAEGQPLDEATLLAINVGARLGVTGGSVAMTPEIAAALPAMTVTLTGPDGVLMQGSGDALLGHPLQAVVWLVQALKAQGRALKPGDVISLGSFGPAAMPQPGADFAVTYGGLPPDQVPDGTLKVRVSFAGQ